MKFGVYAIRDARSGFLSPSLEVSDAVARRNFEHAVLATPDSLFYSHPEDYSFWKVGQFDSDTGALDGFVPPECLDMASDVFHRLKGAEDHA